MDIVRTFVENGIQTSADFKNWTEKEVLALKGNWSCYRSEAKGKWDKV